MRARKDAFEWFRRLSHAAPYASSRLDRRRAFVIATCRLAARMLGGGNLQTVALAIGGYSTVSCLAAGISLGLDHIGLSWMDGDSARAQLVDGLIGTIVPVLTLVLGASLLLISAVVLHAIRRREPAEPR